MRTQVAPHIELDERGIAYIDGTQTKVLTVVRNKQVSRDTPEQLRANMPHLSISQVYAALAFYHDHREEIDRQVELLEERAEHILTGEPVRLSREQLAERRERIRDRTAVGS